MHDNDQQSYVAQPYSMYSQEEDPNYNGLAYPQMQNYPVVHPNHPPRGCRLLSYISARTIRSDPYLLVFNSLFPFYAGQMSNTDMEQALQYQRSMTMLPPQQPFVYQASSPHAGMAISASPPPQSPTNLYDPLSPPVSGSDTSADGIYHSRNNSSAGSPSSSRANSLVHRNPLRYNPTPSPTSSSAGRRSRGRSLSDDEDHMGHNIAESLANTRKEATRRQRIEAEQRRRDELRDGYARLKDVLPVSNQKSSKVSLLERATNHITSLEKTNRQLQTRLAALESEVVRLRQINEKISLSVGGQPDNSPSPSQVNMDSRPLSPPPEGHPSQLTSVAGQEPPVEESSPSASEGGY
ncbi:hypothetical protein EUX98_g3553 [Antrodiella citrinella]|uniref:BHLH domain-containing protein n=1 Tax=Antrodiella citrinella TaxID=2447956 RepID=A0A4S4MXB0_9APHY|nr:hypothetical protein EUX98_g3553 [Antrodiella citrinella]